MVRKAKIVTYVILAFLTLLFVIRTNLLLSVVRAFSLGIGFPKTWAIDCGCLGYKRYFEDSKGVGRCSCYGITTWIWLE